MQGARRLAAVAALLLAFCICARGEEPNSDASGNYPTSNAVKTPRIIHPTPPAYPVDPGLADVKRSYILDVTVGADGIPGNIRSETKEGDPFVAAAIAALKQLEFKPGSLNKKPVPVHVRVWVPFVRGNKHAVPEIVPVNPSEVDKPPTPLKMPKAQLTDEAKRIRFEGTAMLSLAVNEEGMPENARILKPVGYGLDAKALEAVANYRFAPALRYGLPIPCFILIKVDFRLYGRQ